MPRLVYALLCTDVLVERDSNSTSFIRTIDQGTVRVLPAVMPPLFLCTLWELDPEQDKDFSVALVKVAPSGAKEAIGKQVVRNTGARLHKVNFHIPGLNVSEAGRHGIRLAFRPEKNKTEQFELPLYIHLEPAKPAAAPETSH
jgi:hypothetical protein